MGFFGSLFGKKETPVRQLKHPSELQKGDMISLDDSFALPAHLRGQQLRVEAVNTYEYQRSQSTEWVLKGHSGEAIYLGLDEDDETWLAFSLKISRAQVDALFDLDDFSAIFDEPGKAELSTKHSLPRLRSLSNGSGNTTIRSVLLSLAISTGKITVDSGRLRMLTVQQVMPSKAISCWMTMSLALWISKSMKAAKPTLR